MRYLNAVDYGVIGVYFLVLIVIGFILQKKASGSLEDYFLGGRKLPWWALGMSGTASWFDITGTMLIVSFLFMLGPRGIYIEFRGGACLILAFMMIFTGKWHRRSGCITAAEWIAYRFGEGPGGQFARIMGAVSVICLTVGMLAYMIKGVGLFLSMFLPFSPFICALAMLTVATVYTMASGFYGVVVTDVIQTLIVFAAVGVITFMAISHLHDVPNFDDFAEQIVATPAWTSSAPSWEVEMPKGYQAYNHLVMFAFFYLLKNILLGMGSGGDPRYFGARNERECGLLTFLWGWLIMLRWPMMISFAILGMFLVAEFFPNQDTITECRDLIVQHEGEVPRERWEGVVASITNSPEDQDPALIAALKERLGAEDWETKLKMVGHTGNVNPERILPAVLLHRIPMGLRGLLLVSLIAASMSTFDTNVNMATGFFTRDLYQRFFRPAAGNRELIFASYIFGVVLVTAGFTMAYFAKNINDIWGWLIMGLTSGLTVPGIIRLYWWRLNAGGVVAGSIVGMATPFLQRFFFPDLDERWMFVLITAITATATIIGTYMSPPTDRKLLEHFYRTTRPFGFWGPLKSCLKPEVREMMERENRNDIIAIPFVMVWQVTLFLLAMQFVLQTWTSFWITFAIFAVASAGTYWFWYRNLPPARDVLTDEEVETSSASNGPTGG